MSNDSSHWVNHFTISAAAYCYIVAFSLTSSYFLLPTVAMEVLVSLQLLHPHSRPMLHLCNEKWVGMRVHVCVRVCIQTCVRVYASMCIIFHIMIYRAHLSLGHGQLEGITHVMPARHMHAHTHAYMHTCTPIHDARTHAHK